MNANVAHGRTGGSHEAVIDAGTFHEAMGRFVTGVSVVTSTFDGTPAGTTVAALTGVSAEPAMLLACLATSSSTNAVITSSGHFAVNVLGADQADLANQFGRKTADKFGGVPYRTTRGGIPVLEGALAWLVCRVRSVTQAGTHTIFLADVVDASVSDGEPLAYYRAKFGLFERGGERTAYEAVRAMVLRREVPLGAEIVPEELAAGHGLEVSAVRDALIALSLESLVEQRSDSRFAPTPITAAFVDEVFRSREAIELGVIESHLQTAAPDRIEGLRRVGAEIDGYDAITPGELSTFLSLHRRFHVQLVGLAGSARLSESYRRLDIGLVWHSTYDYDEWAGFMRTGLLTALAHAVADRDVPRAKRAVQDVTAYFRDAVKVSIDRLGGAV